MKRILIAVFVALAAGLPLSPSTADAQQKFVVTPLAERKVTELPPGPLYWRVENFGTLADAKAAANAWGLAVEAGGKSWLLTLGPAGGSTAGGTKVADVGPIAQVAAAQYLLRINEGRGAPGSVTPVHSHPGSEAFYVMSGETSSRTSQGVKRIAAGEFGAGNNADTPMQVSSSGTVELRSLVMFVVDAGKPFSTPATLP